MERGSSIFQVRQTKNPLFSTFSVRRTKNLLLSFIFSAGRPKNPPPSSFSDPPGFDERPLAPLSYPEIKIVRPMFDLEDRFENRDRPSTL